MTIDSTKPRTRRAILAGTVGGTVAIAAQALARPLPAEASATHLVYTNDESSITVLTAQSVVQSGFPSSGNGTGVAGMSASSYGVYGESHSAAGVYGRSGPSFVQAPPLTGVFGWAAKDTASVGVFGRSADGTGVRGQSDTHVGVFGSSGPGAPAVNLRVGVYGWGPATSGRSPSYGVIGKSASALGIGVLGSCDAGIGVSATSKTGLALFAGGRVEFKTSGVATIPAGSANVVVAPGLPISENTRILVTLHGDAGGATVLKRVSRNTATDTFKVVLTAASANDCPFSWFLIG